MGLNLSRESKELEEEEEIVDKNFLPGVRDEIKATNSMALDSSLQNNTGSLENIGPKVSLESVSQINQYLDKLDKISLIYLLYDDSLSEIAFQNSLQTLEGSQINILEEWIAYCIKNNVSSWKHILLEALTIIQHYQVLKILGYKKNDMYLTYLPLHKNTSVYVDSHKKRLYRIFENMTNRQSEVFLSIIKEDMESRNLPFQNFNLLHLEMYIIHWTSLKYVSSNDLENIGKAFKVMEMYEEVDELKLPRSSNYENRIPYERSNSIISSASSSIQQDKASNSYSIDHNNPGLCLIINQESFYPEFEPKYKHMCPKLTENLEERKGTNYDRNILYDTFKALSYKIIVKNDLTHFDMEKEIEQTVNSIRDDSSLIICILSHGIEGKIYGSNTIPISIKSIQNTMCTLNSKNLEGKPKILILQSCQGSSCQEVLPVENEEQFAIDGPSGSGKVPKMADLLTFYATVPGFSAIRDKNNGTWFIQSLCKAIRANHEIYHFEEICTLVQREVIEKRWKTKAMVPLKETTLSKFFFLPSIQQSNFNP